ncbi:MAG: disulfide bond formation protein B [Pseudomonadales bacterium]|nr:disulfide bond formation protein B [Pseudomonadales bacterium]
MDNLLPSSRIIALGIFLACFTLLGVGFYMEHSMHLMPCPLCILQRIMFLATGCVGLIAAIHPTKELGIKVYATIMLITATIGAGIASRQLWLQHLPKDKVPACGASLDYLLDVFPITEALTMVLTGDGSCAEVAWQFLGISIPGWSLIGFIGFIAITLLQIFRPKI